LQNGSGPSLKFTGQDVVSGQFGDWTPIAVEKTAAGYEIAWKSLGSNLFSLWNTDGNGNYIANIDGAVSGTDPTLVSAETFFQQDLNGDGSGQWDY
jgi:serralysin